jgi:hypothetical protein
MLNRKSAQSGFALLMTLVVVSAVISIGLTLLELTIKQLRLSTGSKDSESAFHAANAGVECLRYWRLANAGDFETGAMSAASSSVPMTCFGAAVQRPDIVDLTPASPELIFQYDVQFSWGASGAERCSKIRFVTLSSDPTSAGVTLLNVPSYIPSYPETDKVCPPGGRCTIASVQGFNQSCSIVGSGSLGIVQREVLLEL